MVVAVVPVRVVQVPIHQVIRVRTMRYCIVPAVIAMRMARVMARAFMSRGATFRIGVRNLDGVVIIVTFVRMVHVTIMQIVRVVAMLDCSMSAVRAVDMAIVIVMMMVGHFRASV